MVKHGKNVSISEADEEPQLLNQNGKRATDEPVKDGKKKQKTFGLYRQPTAQELNRLQETESLFNSNLFRLQVDEILQEVKVKEKTEKKFTDWFTDFKTYLLAIPEDESEYDLTEQTLFKQLKVKQAVSSELKKTKCMFKFHKFKEVKIVGSYALGCAINSQLKIDLQITVPAETYTKNDSINYRYHKKRAAYLAYIASHVSKNDSIEDLKYTWLHGSETKPVLDFKPSGKLGKHVSVRIDLTCEAEAYKFHRFSPSRNNLRESWLLPAKIENNTNVGPPTPYYNSRVLSDLTASENQELLNDVLSRSENLKQAIVLLKIWLRQRSLQVSGYVVSLLVVYFVQIKRINNIMSSYQIVRNIWIALKTSELDTKGISLHKGDSAPLLEEFHKHFPVVFIDRTGYYNICWEMCKGTYDALRRESSLAVDMLDDGKINSFIPLFMTPIKPLLQFDHILKFKNLPSLKEAILTKASNDSKVNYGVDRLALVTDTLHALLAKGLGGRAELVLQMVDADFSWPVNKSAEKVKSEGFEEKLSFGLILNPEKAMNIVEKGPEANLPEAMQFRSFWGEKSELRRFQDGSIMESCVWGGDSAAERRTISRQIIDYLVKLKFGVPSSELFHIHNQLDTLTARKQFCRDGLLYIEESSLEALQAFDALRRDLRQLTQLPLDVSAVYGVSPVFSYSCPLPPSPRAAPPLPWRRGAACLIHSTTRPDGTASVPDYVPVCEAIIELGYSGKWPGNIEAFRCLKAAFHLQIAERLTKQYSLPAQAYPTHVDVLKNGLVFRLSIAHPKEITLARKVMENGVAKFRETDESLRLQRDTVLMPRLRGALHGLHTKHPAFGPTVCLFKRWLSSHLVSPLFPPAAAELVCARVFRGALPPPAAPATALWRALAWLAGGDWGEVTVLDFNEDFTREEITSIEQQLASDPNRPPLCIVTPFDGTSPSVWTREGPSPEVLARVAALARSTLKYIQEELWEKCNDNVLAAFIPSLAGYDALINLHPHLVPYIAERIDKKPVLQPVPDKPAEDIIPVVEFNPVERYLEELRSAYSDYALFFHDQYGGEIIAVLWKPDIGEYREFQLLAANALTPVKVNGETKYKVNTAALLEDFRILGEGLVSSVTVNS